MADFLVVQSIKNLPARQETWGSIPGSGRSPGVGNGNPLQYSCLENSMDRGAWRATVQGVAKSQTQLSDFHFHFTFTGGLAVKNLPAKQETQETWVRFLGQEDPLE